jgi:hypothetical protein
MFSRSREQYPPCGAWPPQPPRLALDPKAPCPPTWRFLFLLGIASTPRGPSISAHTRILVSRSFVRKKPFGLTAGYARIREVIVQVPGTAKRMSAALCKAAFDRSEVVRRVALRFTEAVLNLSAQTAACNRLHSIEQRCARWLLMAIDRIQSDRMPLTHEFLASMLGVRRAGVTNTAGELQRSGLIRYHHGQLTVVDREGLEATACECHRIDHERLIRLL